jgi:hypothetical protein
VRHPHRPLHTFRTPGPDHADRLLHRERRCAQHAGQLTFSVPFGQQGRHLGRLLHAPDDQRRQLEGRAALGEVSVINSQASRLGSWPQSTEQFERIDRPLRENQLLQLLGIRHSAQIRDRRGQFVEFMTQRRTILADEFDQQGRRIGIHRQGTFPCRALDPGV